MDQWPLCSASNSKVAGSTPAAEVGKEHRIVDFSGAVHYGVFYDRIAILVCETPDNIISVIGECHGVELVGQAKAANATRCPICVVLFTLTLAFAKKSRLVVGPMHTRRVT